MKLINDEYIEEEIEQIPLTEEEKTQQYHDLVIDLIREKYTIDDEFKFINVGLNNRNNLDYVAYRAYVTECKDKAKITSQLV